MKKNMGTADRIIRVFIAIIIFGLGWYFNSWWGLLGIVPLITSITGFCGLYRVLGMSTCSDKEKADTA